MKEKVVHLNKSNFDTFLKDSKSPVLVDFWAPWCMPCRVLGPVMEDLAGEYEGKVTIAKVNVDENPEIASRYQIMGIPTVKIMKDGSEVFSTSGAYPKEYWKDVLDKMN